MSDESTLKQHAEWFAEVGPIIQSIDDPAVDMLAPQLRECLMEQNGMLMIKHPWVNIVVGIMVGQVNRIFTQKIGMTRKYLAERNFDSYLWCVVERPWRLSTLEQLWYRERVTVEQLREMLPGFWSDAEMPTRTLDDPCNLWREVGFATDDPDGWKNVTEDLVAYRGGAPGGISWTLDPNIALWFARRFSRVGERAWKTIIIKDDVLGYVTGRGEKEIILDPIDIEWEEISLDDLERIGNDQAINA